MISVQSTWNIPIIHSRSIVDTCAVLLTICHQSDIEIDALNPDAMVDRAESELFELASAKVKKTLADTIAMRKRVTAALDKIEAGRL